MVKSAYNYINERVQLFLNTFSSDDCLVERWNEEDNQKSFKKLFTNVTNKQEKKKHKDQPKKPNSAYIVFCMLTRPEIVEKHPDLDNNGIMKALAEEWSLIKNDESKILRFKEMAAEDKLIYQEKMAEFKKENPDQVQPKQCKKALSSYIIFCNSRRASLKQEQPSLSPKELISALAGEWKVLKEDGGDEFKKYQKFAEDDKVRYQTEKAAEKREDDGAAEEEKPKVKKAPAKTKAKKKPAKDELPIVKEEEEEDEEVVEIKVPKVEEKTVKKTTTEKKKPAKKVVKEEVLVSNEEEVAPKVEKKKTGYTKFLAATRDSFKKENASLESKQVTSALAAQWRSLSDEEKKEWNDA